MSGSNSLNSFLDEDKYNSERLLALKYIKERVERATTVHNILAPITPQDEYIFEIPRGEDEDTNSELSDPFAELGENIVLSAENKQKRRLSKVEADVLIMNSFPKTHMEIQSELAAELRLDQIPQLDIEEIMQGKLKAENEGELDVINQVAASFDQVGLNVYKEEKRKMEERAKIQGQKPKPKKTKTKEELDLEANSMLSGIWRMLGRVWKFQLTTKFYKKIFLDATSMDQNGFPITQPGYNFYDEKKASTNPVEKTWDQKEEIRKKCEDWLKNVK